MSDITTKASQDVAIQDNDTGTYGAVNSDNEQLVHDQHAIDVLGEIRDGTTIISGNVVTSWENFANQGRAYGAAFGAQFAGGTSEQAFIHMHNPASSGRYVKINKFIFAVTTNTTGTFRVYRHATITADGTPLYVEEYGIHTPPAGNLCDISSIPTYTATGGLFAQFDLNAGGVGLIELDVGLALTLDEDDELLITLEQGSNNNKFSCNVSWAEEDIPAP